MKMSDVEVGMILESGQMLPLSPVKVTALTERGFKYKLFHPVANYPRSGQYIEVDNHEHYGIEGETPYELVSDGALIARNLVKSWCDSSEMWLLHGRPSEFRLSYIEHDIAEVIDRAVNIATSKSKSSEVTPDMIAAGLAIYSDIGFHENPYNMLRDIYLAMQKLQ
jgi:hypothetical protein